MGFLDMRIRNYASWSKLANLGLNVVKCMKIKVLNEKVYLKVFKNQGILYPQVRNGFNTLI